MRPAVLHRLRRKCHGFSISTQDVREKLVRVGERFASGREIISGLLAHFLCVPAFDDDPERCKSGEIVVFQPVIVDNEVINLRGILYFLRSICRFRC